MDMKVMKRPAATKSLGNLAADVHVNVGIVSGLFNALAAQDLPETECLMSLQCAIDRYMDDLRELSQILVATTGDE